MTDKINIYDIWPLWYFWSKIPKFEDLGSKFSKKTGRYEISTFELGYKQNFVKMRKLILFGPTSPHLGIWARNCRKQIVRFEISTLKIWCRQNFVKIRKHTFWPKIPKFWYLGSISEKLKLEENSRFPQFWNFGLFLVVLQFLGGRFGWFRLVPGFSKYNKKYIE